MTASGAKASKKEEVANVFCFVYVGKKRGARKKKEEESSGAKAPQTPRKI